MVKDTQALSLNDALLPFGLFTLGVWLQLIGIWIIGTGVVLAGIFFARKGFFPGEKEFDQRPKLTTKTKWVPATTEEIVRLKHKIGSIKKAIGGWDYIACVLHLLTFFGTLVFYDLLSDIFGGFAFWPYVWPLSLNGFILCLTYLLCTSPDVWTPDRIEFKLPVLENLRSNFTANGGGGDWTREYQLELTDAGSIQVPTDMKLMLKPKDCPKQFLGVQAQVSKNRNGAYVYFVVITRKGTEIMKPVPIKKESSGIISGFLSSFSTMMGSKDPDVIEYKTNDPEVNVLVIRQYADRKGGYITSESDQVRLMQKALLAAKLTLQKIEPAGE